jgi:excisionase family DNA binding protein
MGQVGGHPSGHAMSQTDMLGRSNGHGRGQTDVLGHPSGHGCGHGGQAEMSVKRVAELTGLSERHVRRLCSSGEIRAWLEHGRWMIDPASMPEIGDVADMARPSSELVVVTSPSSAVVMPARAGPIHAAPVDDGLWRVLAWFGAFAWLCGLAGAVLLFLLRR